MNAKWLKLKNGKFSNILKDDIETKEILQKVESEMATQKKPSNKAKCKQIIPCVIISFFFSRYNPCNNLFN